MKAHKTTKNGKTVWRVKWTDLGSGKSRFKQFKTKSAADDWITGQKDKAREHGRKVVDVDTGVITRWIELDGILKKKGRSLIEAGELMEKVWKAKGTESVKITLDVYLDDRKKAGRQASTLSATKGKVRRILSAHRSLDVMNMPVREVTEEIVTVCIKERGKTISTQGLEYERQRLRDFFSWCAQEGLVVASPVPGKSRDQRVNEKKRRKRVVILTPVEARELLRDARAIGHPGIMAWVVLGLFCGLRPDSSFRVRETLEGGTSRLRELHWETLRKSLKSKKLEVVDKVGHREQPLLPEAIQWIKWLIKEYGVITGPVVGKNWTKSLQAFRRGWRDKYEKASWPTDLLRHSFGTYRMMTAETTAVVALEMGNSPGIVEEHYFSRSVNPSHVDDYWSLSPDIFEHGNLVDISQYQLPGEWHESIPSTKLA